MGTLGGTRAQQFAVIDSAMETGARVWRDRLSGQSGLFAELMESQPAADHPLPPIPDWTGQEKLSGEKEMLGFYISGHPLDQYRDKVAELATHTSSSLENLNKHTEGRAVRDPHRHSSASATKRASCGPRCRSRTWKAPSDGMVFSTQYERSALLAQ
jgi:DNA polymerase III alpha subunit